MKHFNTTHRTTLLWLMVLLTSLSSYAQKMVGDGFGGRAGYNPVNLQCGYWDAGILCADKTLRIWGTAEYNLNNGVSTVTSTPTQVTNVSNVRQMALGALTDKSTYIKEDGTGYYFGNPTPYNGSIISNAYHTDAASGVAFVKTDGTVWGAADGLLGPGCPCNNGQSASYCTVQIPSISNAKRVALAKDCKNLVVLLADGTVKTVYGQSTYYPASLISSTPITIPGLSNIVDVKAGQGNYYALTSSGQVYSWGAGTGMGTGVASDLTQYTPQLITFPAGAAPIKAIVPAKGGLYCLALDENDVCYVWGTKFKDNGTTYFSTPQVIATNVRDMAASYYFSYYYKNDGTLWGLGLRNYSMFDQSLTASFFTTLTQLTIPSTLCAIQSFTGMPPCVAGTTAPALTPTTATNSCPTATVNLASLAVSSTTPSGASLIWSTHKTPTSAGDTLTTAQKTAVSTAGKYYAMYYDATNACYSPADSVDITITACPINLANACPTATVNLTTAISASNMPSGASITWHTGTPATTANKVSDPTAISTSGTYYLAFFDGTNNCYSESSQAVTVTITSCVPPLTANTPAAQTATTGTTKTGNAATELAPTGGTSPYTYSDGAGDAACVAPSGATALTGLTVNSDGTYSYTAPATAGTYYYCIKVCDSTTPTAQCVVKTYTLTVTAAASCTISNIMPTFIKN